MTRWEALTARLLEEVERCDELYRPTTFWGPGVRSLLDDLRGRGLESFKSWPSAATWFYPMYGSGFTPRGIDATFEAARKINDQVQGPWFRSALGGDQNARRDFDAARLAWDQARWPFDLERLGESEAGAPPQAYRLVGGSSAFWTRPYLNYLLILAGLSRHVDRPPRRFLELGGGFGILGEIVLSRDADAVYVNVDIPPLLTVASFYLDQLFGDRVATYEGLPEAGRLELDGSACLPSWRIRDVVRPFDVFVNSFSFQEMEPEVVEQYANDVAALDVPWVVSLNSRAGKAVQDAANPIGVRQPVTSRRIAELFEAQGYRCVATYGDPLLQSNAELAILRRGAVAGSGWAGTEGHGADEPVTAGDEKPPTAGAVSAPDGGPIDLRRAITPPTPATRAERKAARRAARIRRKGRGGIGGRFLDLLRAVRRRLR